METQTLTEFDERVSGGDVECHMSSTSKCCLDVAAACRGRTVVRLVESGGPRLRSPGLGGILDGQLVGWAVLG